MGRRRDHWIVEKERLAVTRKIKKKRLLVGRKGEISSEYRRD